MRRHIAGALLVAVLAAGSAEASARWFHVEVREPGVDGTRVKIHLPATLVERSIASVPFHNLDHVSVRVGCAEIEPRDVHALWRVMAAGGSGELSIDGERVFAEREGNHAVLRHGESAWCNAAELRIPLALIAALVNTSSEERVNVRSAMIAMSRMTNSDVLLARADGSTVRVWIDQTPAGGKR